MKEKINIRPGVSSLAQFKTQGYTEWWALAEFVDNSLTSYVLNRKAIRKEEGKTFRLQIKITLDELAQEIRISDNAAGISDKDMERAFEAGSPPPPGERQSLSRFGLGMKAAGIWFADTVEVTTRALGESRTKRVVIDLPSIVEAQDDDTDVDILPIYAHGRGTTVVLRNMTRKVPSGVGPGEVYKVVVDYLSSIYRDFLRQKDIEIIVEAIRGSGKNSVDALEFIEPETLVAPHFNDPEGTPVIWRKSIEFTSSSGKKITGWAALRAKGSYQNTGLVLVWRGKVIIGAASGRDMRENREQPYKPYAIFRNQNSAASLRLIGELDVSEFETTNRKDDLTWSSEESEQFVEDLRAQINSEPMPLIDMAYKYRVPESTPDVVEQWESLVQATAVSATQAIQTLVDDLEFTQAALTLTNLESEFDSEVEGVVEYSYSASGAKDPIRVRIGFANFEAPQTFILQEDADSEIPLVVINRGSRFAASYLDPRLNDVSAFVRTIASMAIAELYLRKAGLGMAGSLRRVFNKVLNSDAMSSPATEVKK